MEQNRNVVLETRKVNKYFYQPVEFHVLKDVDLKVYVGEFVSIMGKSGCGKSTLLYILSTMDTDFQGELFINGESMAGKSPRQLAAVRNKHLGFVFQFHYLLPDFTALQNVMTPALKLAEYSPAEIEARAYEKLALLEMEDHALKRAHRLSGGQQQRVAIARALVNDPRIIMGDEPTGNLDSYNSGRVQDIFRKLVEEEDQTILSVTHDEDFARDGDRIVTMQDGEIIGVEPTKRFKSAGKNRSRN